MEKSATTQLEKAEIEEWMTLCNFGYPPHHKVLNKIWDMYSQKKSKIYLIMNLAIQKFSHFLL